MGFLLGFVLGKFGLRPAAWAVDSGVAGSMRLNARLSQFHFERLHKKAVAGGFGSQFLEELRNMDADDPNFHHGGLESAIAYRRVRHHFSAQTT